jgi:5-methylthioadenosine/S-adenosylhomocysteine deaminase
MFRRFSPLVCFISLAVVACDNEATQQTTGTSPDPGDRIDLIIEGDYVVTMDDDDKVIADGAVAIDGGLIIAMGTAEEINAQYAASGHLPGDNRIVMPGLVNGHSHAAMTLLRGIADDLSLLDWLTNYIFPAEVEFVDPEFVRIGTELACWEMIRGGTTTFVDMYYYPDVIAQVVESCGLRAFVSATVIDQRSPDAEDAADSLGKGAAFIENWKGRSDRITPIFGPHANYTLNVEQLTATRNAANEAGIPISIHMSESPYELEYSKQNYGMTSIELFESIGFLDSVFSMDQRLVHMSSGRLRLKSASSRDARLA